MTMLYDERVTLAGGLCGLMVGYTCKWDDGGGVKSSEKLPAKMTDFRLLGRIPNLKYE